jgi:hypothetical protein
MGKKNRVVLSRISFPSSSSLFSLSWSLLLVSLSVSFARAQHLRKTGACLLLAGGMSGPTVTNLNPRVPLTTRPKRDGTAKRLAWVGSVL